MSVNVLGFNPAMRISTGFLNTVDDPVPGQLLASPSGSIIQGYNGMVGGKLHLDTPQALKLSATAVATLYAGVYMYVKFKAGSAAANARGQLVFWDDPDNYVVTPDAAAGNIMFPAGVTLNAVTKGQYGFIQIAGKAALKFKAAITKAAPAAGDLVLVDSAPTNTGEVLADATSLTSPTAKLVIGTAIEAPANGAIKLVRLGGHALSLMVL